MSEQDVPVRVPVEAGSQIKALVPTSLDQAFRLAAHIHESGLAPKGLVSAQAVMVVIMKGLEVGLPPMAALETIGVINGRPCIYGDGIPALLWSKGFKIKEWYVNEENLEKCEAHCRITRPDGDVYEFKYTAQDAKDNRLWDTREKVTKRSKDGNRTYTVDNDSPWYRYKKRMLRHRARGWLSRDCASDVLKGMPIYEEERDMIDVTEIDAEPAQVEPRKSIVPTSLGVDIPDTEIPDNEQAGTALVNKGESSDAA